MKFWTVLLLVLGLGIFGAGCGGGDDDGGGGGESTDDPIVIGHPTALSGPLSVYGIPINRAMEMAIEDINAEGGIDGRQVELITADNQTDINLVAPTTREVLEQGADILIPYCDYDFGSPAAEIAAAENILSITCAGAPQFGFQGVGPLAFNSYQAAPTETAAIAQYAADNGIKRPYLLVDTTLEYTQEACDYFKQAFTSLVPDGEIAGEDTFANDDTAINAQVTRMRGSNADAVMLCSYLPGAAMALRQIRSGGIDLPIYALSTVDGRDWTEGVPKKDLNEIYFPTVVSWAGDDPDDRVNQLFADYEEQYGEATDQAFTALGYAQIETLKLAIERAGTTDGDALAAEIEKFDNEDLIAGPTTYTEECHIPVGREMRMRKFENGQTKFLEMVTPSEVPEAPC